MWNAAIALVINVGLLVALLQLTSLGIYAVLVATIVYSIVICILNDISMKKYIHYKNPWGKLVTILTTLYPIDRNNTIAQETIIPQSHSIKNE